MASSDSEMSTHDESVVGRLLAEELEEDTLAVEEGEILDDIIQESSPVDFSPPLKDKVNTVLKNFMGGDLVLKGTTDKVKDVLTPQGSEFMDRMRVNDSIYPLLSSQLKKENGELLKVESALCKASIVQARLMEKLLEVRNLLPAGQASVVKGLIRDAATAIEIQGFGRIKLNEWRRENIVKSLNPEFKSVLSTTSPGEGWLFGAGLGDSLKEIESSNKLTARLNYKPSRRDYKKDQSFLERGQASRGRGRPRFQRYQGQRTYGRRQNGYERKRSPSPVARTQVKQR